VPNGSTTKDRALLDATVAVLADKGYGALTTAEVAKRAGVSTATLYRRWRSKQDLVVGTARYWATELATTPTTGSLREDLRIVLRDKFGTLFGPVGPLLLALIGEAAHNRVLGQALDTAFVQPMRARLADVLDNAVLRGELASAEDLAVLTDLVIGGTISAAFFTGRGPGAGPQAAADELLPALMRMLTTGQTTRPRHTGIDEHHPRPARWQMLNNPSHRSS
jgi:AcrR family transcriptional regulator